MHILIIPSEHFVTLNYPLGGIFQFHQAAALHDAGHQVGVISSGVITSRFMLKSYHYPEFEQIQGYPVYRSYVRKLQLQRWVKPSKGIAFSQKQGLELYERYKNRFGKPDVVHAHNIKYAGFVAQEIKAKDDVPYVITEHSSEFMRTAITSDFGALIQSSTQHASSVTAVSHALAEALEQQVGIQEIGVLPNIIDSTLLNAPLLKYRNSDFVFLNIASLDTNKNQAMLIEAFACHFRGKQVCLRIAGLGPLEGHLKKLAETLGIKEQVDFLGFLDRASVVREMQAADCFVLSSFKETFGVVLIEALASGTPLIATRCGGADNIVTDKNGVLVDPGDVVALSGAMTKMLETSTNYHPKSLRQECKFRFGEATFTQHVNQLYTQAMRS